MSRTPTQREIFAQFSFREAAARRHGRKYLGQVKCPCGWTQPDDDINRSGIVSTSSANFFLLLSNRGADYKSWEDQQKDPLQKR